MTTKQKQPRLPPISEADIQAQVVEVLAMLGVTVERQNTGVGSYPNADGTQRRVRYGQPGNLDLAGDIDGRRLEVEVKRPPHHGARGQLVRSRPTREQYERMNKINESGGIAFWLWDPSILFVMVPKLRAGCRVYIDRSGDVVLTDEPVDLEIEGWMP